VIKVFMRGRRSQVVIAAVILHSSFVRAEEPNATPFSDDDTGFALLSNATNVTKWGLGVGAGVEQSPYRGDGAKFSPIPIVYFDDKWVHFAGTTLDLKIGNWSSVLFSLRGTYAIEEGYKGSDATALNGMQNRKGAFWYGPALEWKTGIGTLSGDFLTSGNKGQRASVDFSHAFEYGKFSIEPHVGAEWLSRKYVDYYYGVRPSETRAGRNEYTGKATYDVSVGTRVDYRLTQHQIVSLDVSVSRLGSGIKDSPIVGKSTIPEARLGYLYQFK
jgi:MipA family protein